MVDDFRLIEKIKKCWLGILGNYLTAKILMKQLEYTLRLKKY